MRKIQSIFFNMDADADALTLHYRVMFYFGTCVF